MAGGRRPTNYNPTLRSSGHALAQAQTPNSTAVGSPHYWPSSIWQLPDLSATSPPSVPMQPPKRAPPTQQHVAAAGSQLAQALDAAVQAAVIRALDFSSGVGPALKTTTDDDNASSASCSSTRSVQPEDALASRLRTVMDANALLRSRADAAEQRADLLEARVAELELAVREAKMEKENMVERLEKRMNEMERRTLEQGAVLREQISCLTKSDSRTIQERSRTERANQEQVSSMIRRVECVEATLSQVAAGLSSRMADIEATEVKRKKDESRDELLSQKNGVELEKKVSNAVSQSVGSLRNRIRKLEAALETKRKSDEESNALQIGSIEARMDKSQSEVAALKKLVEQNLRAHSSAQDIVKQQVSTVTKHVCAAMRAYTTRRLEENTKVRQCTPHTKIHHH